MFSREIERESLIARHSVPTFWLERYDSIFVEFKDGYFDRIECLFGDEKVEIVKNWIAMYKVVAKLKVARAFLRGLVAGTGWWWTRWWGSEVSGPMAFRHCGTHVYLSSNDFIRVHTRNFSPHSLRTRDAILWPLCVCVCVCLFNVRAEHVIKSRVLKAPREAKDAEGGKPPDFYLILLII